ncbi:MAG: hypothetical protein NPIRA05_23230 [Nitrospirales bacterium]|nr:MAG: hypothetical protein NPIRA05_23230 [Nitrospirales bacterium]
MEKTDLDNQFPKVTVGTLSRNGIQRLRISIPTIQQLDYPNLDFLVVDGGSTDESIEYLQQFPNIRIVTLEGEFSVTKGRNRLVREANTPYVFMVDNDIEIIDPQLLRKLLRRYQQHPDLAFLSPLVLDADTEMLSEVGLSHTRIQRKQPLDRVLGHGLVEASGYYGNCVLFRTQLLENLGAHDERYPYHNNDYDLGARAYLKGFRVMIETDQYVIHHGYAARVQLSPVAWRYQYHLSSMCRIICKNYRFKNLLFWLPATIGWTLIKALRLSVINQSARPLLSTGKSFYYFLRDLPDTLRMRKQTQQSRVALEDSFLKIPPARF